MGKIGKEKEPLLVSVANILAEAMWKNYQIAVNLAKIPKTNGVRSFFLPHITFGMSKITDYLNSYFEVEPIKGHSRDLACDTPLDNSVLRRDFKSIASNKFLYLKHHAPSENNKENLFITPRPPNFHLFK